MPPLRGTEYPRAFNEKKISSSFLPKASPVSALAQRGDETRTQKQRRAGPDSQIPFRTHRVSVSIVVFAGDRALGRPRIGRDHNVGGRCRMTLWRGALRGARDRACRARNNREHHGGEALGIYRDMGIGTWAWKDLGCMMNGPKGILEEVCCNMSSGLRPEVALCLWSTYSTQHEGQEFPSCSPFAS